MTERLTDAELDFEIKVAHRECSYPMCEGHPPHCVWHGHESEGWPCVSVRAIAELRGLRAGRTQFDRLFDAQLAEIAGLRAENAALLDEIERLREFGRDTEPYGECDWGGCHAEATRWRYGDPAHGHLPVCGAHSLEAENAKLQAAHSECKAIIDSTEAHATAWKVEYNREFDKNAKLQAAGERLAACYEICLCPYYGKGNTDPDCLGWPMLFAALASVKGEGL